MQRPEDKFLVRSKKERKKEAVVETYRFPAGDKINKKQEQKL